MWMKIGGRGCCCSGKSQVLKTMMSQFVILSCLLPLTRPYRTWRKLYMDVDGDCHSVIRNDDMNDDDRYIVYSDNWNGRSEIERMPAECAIHFNFGDRLVAFTITDLRCDHLYKDPFFGIYDNCEGRREGEIIHYNCSHSGMPLPQTMHSSSSCITLYHHRGHLRKGYFFAMQIIAGEEIIAFPAGGIAAIIIACIVSILFIVKLVCCLSGYESRIPDVELYPDDKAGILTHAGFENRTIVDTTSPAAAAAAVAAATRGSDDGDGASVADELIPPIAPAGPVREVHWEREKFIRTESTQSTSSIHSELEQPHSSCHSPQLSRLDRDIPPPPRPARSTGSGRNSNIRTCRV